MDYLIRYSDRPWSAQHFGRFQRFRSSRDRFKQFDRRPGCRCVKGSGCIHTHVKSWVIYVRIVPIPGLTRITRIICNETNSQREWCGVSKRWFLLGLYLTQLFSGDGAIAIFIKELERLKHCTRNRRHLPTQHEAPARRAAHKCCDEGLAGSQKSYFFLWLSLHFSSHHHKSFDRQKVSKHTTKWRQNDVKLCEFLQTLILSKLLDKLTIAQFES